MKLSADIIKAAINNDEDAVVTVLRHFDKYITSLSIERHLGKNEQFSTRVNEDTKQQLQFKLLSALSKFDVRRGEKK